MEQTTFAVLTLGCKLNFAESSTLARGFVQAGLVRVEPHEAADIYVVNTCSVTAHADKKDRQAVRHLLHKHPGAFVVVTGCYAQLRPQDLEAISGVALVVDNANKDQLVARTLEAFRQREAVPRLCCSPILQSPAMFPAWSQGDRTRSFLKVQDGCDYYCAYCTVPLARGRSRNFPVADLVAQARTIAAEGTREIVLTGVNIGDFGKTTGESFFDLLQALVQVEGIDRYRISSIEPNLLRPEWIAWMAGQPKLMPHFHIPLQSGSDTILRAMGRRYDTALFRERMACIRQYLPQAFVGLDVIVGFPGETPALFGETCTLLEELSPTYLHLFPYSVRPHTAAADRIPAALRVEEAEKDRRMRVLEALSAKNHKAFVQAHIGRQARVLFEAKCADGRMSGFTDNYVKVSRPYDPSLLGKMVTLQIGAEDVEA